MTPEEFRAAAHALVDWIADHRERIPDLPVAAQVAPGEVAAGLAAQAPEHPEPFADVLADLERVVVPGITQTQSPHFFGWFPSNGSLSSVLGDVASSGLGALGITWQSAPALTEVEEVVVRWLGELLRELRHLPLEELCDRVLGELAGRVEDDVALLAIRAHPEDRPRPASAGPVRLPEGHSALH